MAYVELTSKGTTDEFCSTDWNDFAGNMNLSVPNIFEAAGDIAVGTGNQAMTRLAIGDEHDVLQSRAAATLGVEWCGQIGVELTTDTFSIPNAAETIIPFYTETLDTDNFHEVSPTSDANVITIPFDGTYLITLTGTFAVNTTGYRRLAVGLHYDGGSITRHGNTLLADSTVDDVGVSYSFIHPLKANDYLYAYAFQNSGGALNLDNIELRVYLMR